MPCRWKICTHATKSKFSAKVSQLYANSHDGKNTKEQTAKLIENLRASFQDILQSADWMDSGKV